MLETKKAANSSQDFLKALTVNDRLNHFLRRNLANNKKARAAKGRSNDIKIPRVILEETSHEEKVKDAYGTSCAAFQTAEIADTTPDTNMLEMYFSENIKHSHRPNKLKLNMKKMPSVGLMKNRFNQIKFPKHWIQKVAGETQYAWTKTNIAMGGKKPSASERRPCTDMLGHRKLDNHKMGNNQGRETSYQNTRKLSKLFKKAGAGRFSQNIANRVERTTSGSFQPSFVNYTKDQPTVCGQLYSWGSSRDGVLGHETPDQDDKTLKIDENGYMICNAPKLINYFTKFSVKVTKMACGAGHIVVLANNHKLYSWGCNRLGQLGLNLKQENISTPQEILTLRGKNVSKVFWGAGHSFALDSYGTVYSWGASADYQTGHSQNEVDIYWPKRIEFDTLGNCKIKDIACGIKHTLMLTIKNEVMSFGCTEYGQWGQGLSSKVPGK